MIPVDKYHGVGGSYILDPATGERKQVEAPTQPHPDGSGARDEKGKLLNQANDKLEPAFEASPAAAAVAVEKTKRAGRLPGADKGD